VKEEEKEMFPDLAKAVGAKRLNEIGAQLARDKKTAPRRPSKATAAKSPGASLLGMAEAATQRVTRMFQANASPQTRTAGSRKATRRTARPGVKVAAKKRAVAKKRVGAKRK
jgi:hypothetical protein